MTGLDHTPEAQQGKVRLEADKPPQLDLLAKTAPLESVTCSLKIAQKSKKAELGVHYSDASLMIDMLEPLE